MERYEIKLTGQTPLIQHALSVRWNDIIKKWQTDPANRGASVAGDNRTPAFTWIGCMYVSMDRKRVVLPSDNLMTTIREGGAKCPTGKGKGSFKSITQSGITLEKVEWDLINPDTGKAYDVTGIDDLMKESNYEKHVAWAQKRGFELFEKHGKVGTAKHIFVRPIFHKWEASGIVTVLDAQITKHVLENIVKFSGVYSGLCDWRPSAPKSPGTFGRFSAEVKEI